MKYKIQDVRTGMVIATDIVSRGICLVRNGTTLNSQMIKVLRENGVDSVEIKNPLDFRKEQPQKPVEHMSYEEKIEEVRKTFSNIPVDQVKQQESQHYRTMRESQAFKEFSALYMEKIVEFKSKLSDFLLRQDNVDADSLIYVTQKLVGKTAVNSSYDTLNMLLCLENFDDSVYAHSLNVAIIARILGDWMGWSEKDQDTLTLGGLLHDIGKTKLDQTILFKKGKLTPEEFAVVKRHPSLGFNLIKDFPEISADVKLCVLQHHEKNDGTGYPMGVTSERINRFAKIITIADVYDAMTADRCYRKAASPFEALGVIQGEVVSKYDPLTSMTFMSRVVNSYLGEIAVLSDNRKVRILKMDERDMRHPLVVDIADNSIIDLNKVDVEIVRLL